MTLLEALEKKRNEKEWMFWEKNLLNLIRNGKIFVNGIQVKSPKHPVIVGDKILKGKPNIDSIAWEVKE